MSPGFPEKWINLNQLFCLERLNLVLPILFQAIAVIVFELEL